MIIRLDLNMLCTTDEGQVLPDSQALHNVTLHMPEYISDEDIQIFAEDFRLKAIKFLTEARFAATKL